MINNAWAGTMNMRAEINRLHADVGRLTKERDDEKERAESLERQLTTALVHHEAAYNDSLAAEKSRDEAVAELNKALETLGQLRSDLQKAEEEITAKDEIASQLNEARLKHFYRAQSAEASLAKLREAETCMDWKAKIHKAADLVVQATNPPRGPGDDYDDEFADKGQRLAGALRSLLDEPDKGGK